MNYVMLALSEPGIEGEEAEMRAMTFLCNMTYWGYYLKFRESNI